MADRLSLAQDLLKSAGWAGADISLLAGDASNRKYYRLRLSSGVETAVLMDAPTDKGEDVRPFSRIARILVHEGFSAPSILAADEVNGFLLIEDLGDALFARVIEKDTALEEPLYGAATDVLIALHERPLPEGLQDYGPDIMADMAALAFDWYAPSDDPDGPNAKDALRSRIRSVLRRHADPADVLIQRDYHAENLLWLPDRVGIERVGLLDFQDAMQGHRAYDLVSLLQDARRDVSPKIETAMIAHYVDATGADADVFRAAYCALGAQRNLRILGVFARLCLRDGKAGYIDLIPRVWAHLMSDLQHPTLTDVARIVSDHLPPPTPAILDRLKDQCLTHQQP